MAGYQCHQNGVFSRPGTLPENQSWYFKPKKTCIPVIGSSQVFDWFLIHSLCSSSLPQLICEHCKSSEYSKKFLKVKSTVVSVDKVTQSYEYIFTIYMHAHAYICVYAYTYSSIHIPWVYTYIHIYYIYIYILYMYRSIFVKICI